MENTKKMSANEAANATINEKSSGEKYLANALSLQMLDLNKAQCLFVTPIQGGDIPEEAESYVGHADTARVLTRELQREVPFHRGNLSLDTKKGDELYVAQYTGGRLPEGATQLPEGTSFAYAKIVPTAKILLLTEFWPEPGAFSGGLEWPVRAFPTAEAVRKYVGVEYPDATPQNWDYSQETFKESWWNPNNGNGTQLRLYEVTLG